MYSVPRVIKSSSDEIPDLQNNVVSQNTTATVTPPSLTSPELKGIPNSSYITMYETHRNFSDTQLSNVLII